MDNFRSFFVNSYPRSGNTWIRLVLLDTLKAKPIDLNPVFTTKFRFFQSQKYSPITPADHEGCIFKSHLMYDQSPQQLDPFKGIYLVRDGRDSLLSYYFYNVKHKGYTETWDDFFNRYFIRRAPLSYREKILLRKMSGWGENIQSYSGRENVIIIRYEDLLSNTLKNIESAFDFLGIDKARYRQSLERSLQVSNENVNQKARRDQAERKRGVTGAWQDFFSDTQNKAFIDRYGNHLEKFGYLKA